MSKSRSRSLTEQLHAVCGHFLYPNSKKLTKKHISVRQLVKLEHRLTEL